MSEVKHTPGPWEPIGNLVRTQFGLGNPDMRGLLVAECPGHTPESNANARLIAAAPELLEALQDALKAGVIDMNGEPDAARAAIAKATGASA